MIHELYDPFVRLIEDWHLNFEGYRLHHPYWTQAERKQFRIAMTERVRMMVRMISELQDTVRSGDVPEDHFDEAFLKTIMALRKDLEDHIERVWSWLHETFGNDEDPSEAINDWVVYFEEYEWLIKLLCSGYPAYKGPFRLVDTQRWKSHDNKVILHIYFKDGEGHPIFKRLILQTIVNKDLIWHYYTERNFIGTQGDIANKTLDRIDRWLEEAFEELPEKMPASGIMKRIVMQVAAKEAANREKYPEKGSYVTEIFRLIESDEETAE